MPSIAGAASEQVRAGPRTIEPGSPGHASRDAWQEKRELWARDMKVRAEQASRPPDGELRSLPSFEYSVGPDGRVYATGGPPVVPVVREEPEASHDPSRGPEPPPGTTASKPTESRDRAIVPFGSSARSDDVLEDPPGEADAPTHTRAVLRAYAPTTEEPPAKGIDTVT